MIELLKVYAKKYHELGFNVTCITNYLTEFNFGFKSITKTPYHSCNSLNEKRQSIEDIDKLDWKNATGVGFYLSSTNPETDNYVVLDIDGCQNEELIDEILISLGLHLDYKWLIKSGSHNGFHIIFRLLEYSDADYYYMEHHEDEEKNYVQDIASILGSYSVKQEFKNKIERIEILSDCNLMLPPSTHISTLEYEFMNCDFPSSSPSFVDASDLNNFFHDFLEQRIKKSSAGKIIEQKLAKTSPEFKELSIRNHKRFRLSHLDYQPFYTLIFDCETSGLPDNINLSYKETEKWPRLIQISWVILVDNKYFLKQKTEVVAGENFNQINAINLDYNKIKRIGKPIREVLKSFSNDLKEVDKIVAHNLEFDKKIVQSEFYRLGMPDIFSDKIRCCTMKESANLIKADDTGFQKYPSLQELHKLILNENFNNSHNAISDVLATTRCYSVLAEKKVKPFYDSISSY